MHTIRKASNSTVVCWQHRSIENTSGCALQRVFMFSNIHHDHMISFHHVSVITAEHSFMPLPFDHHPLPQFISPHLFDIISDTHALS